MATEIEAVVSGLIFDKIQTQVISQIRSVLHKIVFSITLAVMATIFLG